MMKRFLMLIGLCLIAVMAISAKTCGYCHGKGRIKIPGVSAFEAGPHYKKCRVCGQKYDTTTDHWHSCPHCHGSGEVDGHSSNHDDNADVGEDIYLRYLTPEEYQDWKMQIDISIKGIDRKEKCPDCNGSGLCKACNGTGLSPIQGPVDPDFGYFPNPCPICAGIKSCKRCSGLKWILVHSDDGKAQAIKKLEYYRDLVNRRMANRR